MSVSSKNMDFFKSLEAYENMKEMIFYLITKL